MKPISLGGYGELEFVKDHWQCWGASTPIGDIDIEFDFDGELPAAVGGMLMAALDKIEEIHSLAASYLQTHAPEDHARAQSLQEPSLIFREVGSEGSFTIFYSGSDPDDETIYGVEFRNYVPFNLTIGD